MMGVWNARLLDDSLHKALYGRGKALYQSTHHYKDFGLLGSKPRAVDWARLRIERGCRDHHPQIRILSLRSAAIYTMGCKRRR